MDSERLKEIEQHKKLHNYEPRVRKALNKAGVSYS